MTSGPVWTRVLLGLLVAAIAGWSVFAFLAWRAVTVEHTDVPEAMRRLADVRARFGSVAPVLQIAPDGTIVTRADSKSASPDAIARLNVLAYRPGEQRFIRAEVPFWFFRLKAPAADYALRGTGLSFEQLGITADDLEAYGPGLILDHTTAGGNQLLVWTE